MTRPHGPGARQLPRRPGVHRIERGLVLERTVAGLAAARERGRVGGRPSVMTPAKLRQLERMTAAGEKPGEIAKALGVGRATVYRHLPVTAEGSR